MVTTRVTLGLVFGRVEAVLAAASTRGAVVDAPAQLTPSQPLRYRQTS